MAFLQPKLPFSASERLERRRLIFSDTLSLATLFVITALLAVVTNAFYQSYASHEAESRQRWVERARRAMQRGDAQAAVNALRSALALGPGDRSIEMSLAEALASAGRLPEASSYFTTLAESEPGDGMIQLQLARLAARQGNTDQALEDYHRAIYGNWEGDGSVRRREVRLEMVGFLISHGLSNEARNELLVAAGNAPEGDSGLFLNIAQLMEKAQAPADALNVYKSLLEYHPTLFEALEGAGRAAFQLGRYAEASRYLERTVNAPEAARQPPQEVQQTQEMLNQSERLLLLYPSPQLRPRDRNLRILADLKIAQARLTSCAASAAKSSTAAASPAPATSEPAPRRGPLQSLARRFERYPAPTSNESAPPSSPAEELESLTARWKQQPETISASSLENDPDLAAAQIQLIYDTERITQQVCGQPTGDDALLLKIARAPSAVDEE